MEYDIIDGHHIKKSRMNDIASVEIKRHNALKESKKFYQKYYEPFNAYTKKLKSFWGYRKASKIKSPVLYDIDTMGGLSWAWVKMDDDKFKVLRTTYKELPLLLNEELNPEAYKILEQRLKGRIKQCTHQQKLIDKHIWLNYRYNGINKVLWLCDTIMQRIIEVKYNFYMNGSSAMRCVININDKVLLKLKVNGRKYYYSCLPRGGFKRLSLEGDSRINIEI